MKLSIPVLITYSLVLTLGAMVITLGVCVPGVFAEAPVPTTQISELTQLRVDNAYKKVLMAQQALNVAIGSFNEAIQKGVVDEKVPAGKTLRYDPATEKVSVVDIPKTPSLAPSVESPIPQGGKK
jgi:hypothetical protein